MTAVPVPPDTSIRAGVRSLVRDRLMDAAAAVFADEGWRRLTMSKVADRAGVSRQTVYNEFGTKLNLAEELVFRELDEFLSLVRSRIESAGDPVEAIAGAAEGALTLANVNPLLKAILDSAHAGDTELLPFITQSEVLVDRARVAVVDAMTVKFPQLPFNGDQLHVAADALVRLVLSHVTQPAREPAAIAFELAWMVGSMLKGVDDA